MWKKIIWFLGAMIKDDNGNISSIRVMSWFSLFIASYATLKLRETGVEIIVAWLVAAFCPKVLQKVVENKKTKIE